MPLLCGATDQHFSASSHSRSSVAASVQSGGKGWTPAQGDEAPWVQVDVGDADVPVRTIAVYGMGRHGPPVVRVSLKASDGEWEWVTADGASATDDENTALAAADGAGAVRVTSPDAADAFEFDDAPEFPVNGEDATQPPMFCVLARPVPATSVRLHVRQGCKGLTLNVYGGEGFDAFLGRTRDEDAAAQQFSASCSAREDRGPYAAVQLRGGAHHGWVANPQTAEPWWQFEARSVQTFIACQVERAGKVGGVVWWVVCGVGWVVWWCMWYGLSVVAVCVLGWVVAESVCGCLL